MILRGDNCQTTKYDHGKSVKLVSIRTLVKFARKIKKEDMSQNASKFETILDDLLLIMDGSQKEVMHLPIQAF
jgi:hypothetical protein